MCVHVGACVWACAHVRAGVHACAYACACVRARAWARASSGSSSESAAPPRADLLPPRPFLAAVRLDVRDADAVAPRLDVRAFRPLVLTLAAAALPPSSPDRVFRRAAGVSTAGLLRLRGMAPHPAQGGLGLCSWGLARDQTGGWGWVGRHF